MRAATAADIETYYGVPQGPTLRALVAELDGQPIGVIGLARQGPVSRLFSEFRPELRPHLKSMAVLRGIKTVLRWVEAAKIPVYALAQCDEPDAHRLLKRLGFEQRDDEVYLWRT